MAANQPSKTRVLWLILAGAGVIYLALSFFTSKRPVMESVQVSMSGPPSIQSVPGSVKDNVRYKELQEEANKKQAEQAKKSGRTALPTLVNKAKEEQTDEEFFHDLKKQPATPVDEKTSREDALKKAQDDADRRLKEQQARLDKLKKEQDDKRKAAEASRSEQQKNQQQAKELEGLVSLMMTEMGNVTKVFAPPAKQVYVSGQTSTPSPDLSTSGNRKNPPNQVAATPQPSAPLSSNTNALPPLYKAGAVVYGILETSYDSDDGGPVLVKITTGPLAGSRLIGTVSNPSTWANGVKMTFNTIAMPYAATSQSINIQAVDPGTLRPSIHASVNRHYGQKYGSLLLAGAISQGASQASSNASSNSSGSSGSSGATTTSSSSPSSSTNGLASIGTPVANDLVANLTQAASRPPTYCVEQGASIGLMFTSDFTPAS